MSAEYDLVVRGGRIYDGSGAPSYVGDVGITNGLITKVGRIRERGLREVDADGLAVTPGFVDGHTHMDAQVMWDPLGSCSCWHGVTTVVMGNCGFTLAPVRRGQENLVVGSLERAEDISAAALSAGISWTWESFADYMDTVDRQPKAINYGAQIGHSALRTWAMGAAAFERAASADETALMCQELTDALQAGALGFTSSRSINHETASDKPVASRLAKWEEVVALVMAMSQTGNGVFELSQETTALLGGPETRADYERRLTALAVQSGVPIAFGVGSTRQLPFLDRVSAAGGRVIGLSHSRGISLLLSFRTQLPFDKLPEWREVRRLPLAEQQALLKEPQVRERLVRAANEGSYGRAIGAEARRPDYEIIRILDNALPPNPTVGALARQRGVDPVELIINLSVESNFEQFFVQPITAIDEDELLAVMKHPQTVMTFSDSGAHVSQIIDSSIQTHLLGHWTRNKQAFTLEEAIRMITYVPAAAWGLNDRGLIREGMSADLNVIDPETITPLMPELVNDLPGGAKRLIQKAAGIHHTVVNGVETFAGGEHTGAVAGRLLRRRQAA
jgi:N-acyl-D-amino-acid deacylase